jgi:hypothetical protein
MRPPLIIAVGEDSERSDGGRGPRHRLAATSGIWPVSGHRTLTITRKGAAPGVDGAGNAVSPAACCYYFWAGCKGSGRCSLRWLSPRAMTSSGSPVQAARVEPRQAPGKFRSTTGHFRHVLTRVEDRGRRGRCRKNQAPASARRDAGAKAQLAAVSSSPRASFPGRPAPRPAAWACRPG